MTTMTDAGRRMWAIALAILMWTLVGPHLGLGSGSVVHAAPQVDPTTNFRMWGSPSFNRQIGPDDVVVQVAGGYDFTVSLLSDGSVACWGYNEYGQCDVPSGIGTPENPVTS
ncbi:MAG: RCC1 domain-containing protein, partial [Planctomycetota bacterium]|nr:RCC1 domain-containing protein [Planctomycetota bacterium]